MKRSLPWAFPLAGAGQLEIEVRNIHHFIKKENLQ